MNKLRRDFLYFNQNIPTVFFDSAASSQKPQSVLHRIKSFYSFEYYHIMDINYNNLIDESRRLITELINARYKEEIIFTKNATDSINLVTYNYLANVLLAGDNIVISTIEHHANIIPWQKICHKFGACIKIFLINENGKLNIQQLIQIVSSRTKLVVITYMSNILGSIIDIKTIISYTKHFDIKILLDASQAISHYFVNVLDIDCDFLVFSAHKMYGPNGLGILYIKSSVLSNMCFYNFYSFLLKKKLYLNASHKSNLAAFIIPQIITFGTSLKYLSKTIWQEYWSTELMICQIIRDELQDMKDYIVLGNDNTIIISILHTYLNSLDIIDVLNINNIAVRIGHHCSQPLVNQLCHNGLIRISFGIYNNFNDIKKILFILKNVDKFIT